VPQSAGQ